MRKRYISATVMVFAFLLSIILRLGYIALSNTYSVAGSYNSNSIVIDVLKPNIYYSNYSKITNNAYEKYALLKPNAKTAAELSELFDNSDELLEELRKGKPLLVKTDKMQSDYIKLFNVKITKNNCSQLISAQCSGLLSALPLSVGSRKLSYYVDAKGRMLSGDEGRIIYDNYVTSEGLLLFLDENVQNVTYKACESIKNGCAVVMDVESSKILACVTKPDSSYINKPCALYSVGSVFKVLIAACALENRLNPIYKCVGKIKIGDTVYSCQKHRKHGKQDLESALANSCNCYFVNLAVRLGAERILKTANDFGFGSEIKLYKNFKFTGSELPDLSELKNMGELPLIGFGQGKLMSTPLQLCNMLCTVANNGYLNQIKLVDSEVDKYGNKAPLKYNSAEKVISNKTSYLLLKYIRSVVAYGTGRNADYNSNSAGKTGTAQTGQYENGKEKLNTWFAGIYPYDNPKYAIVVMCEDGTSGAADCCPVFRTIVEKLD